MQKFVCIIFFLVFIFLFTSCSNSDHAPFKPIIISSEKKQTHNLKTSIVDDAVVAADLVQPDISSNDNTDELIKHKIKNHDSLIEKMNNNLQTINDLLTETPNSYENKKNQLKILQNMIQIKCISEIYSNEIDANKKSFINSTLQYFNVKMENIPIYFNCTNDGHLFIFIKSPTTNPELHYADLINKLRNDENELDFLSELILDKRNFGELYYEDFFNLNRSLDLYLKINSIRNDLEKNVFSNDNLNTIKQYNKLKLDYSKKINSKSWFVLSLPNDTNELENFEAIFTDENKIDYDLYLK